MSTNSNITKNKLTIITLLKAFIKNAFFFREGFCERKYI